MEDHNTKAYKFRLTFTAKSHMTAITLALRGQESEQTQEAIRVINVILRQHSSMQGCLLVPQSFFHNYLSKFVDLDGNAMCCRGFHSSFRTSQNVTMAMIVKPGPVIDFFLANQNFPDPERPGWSKAKCALKDLRTRTSPANSHYKIVGFWHRPCSEQMFTLKHRNGDFEEKNAYDSFVKNCGIELRYSDGYLFINVGRPMRPELCTIVPLQRYTEALSALQSSSPEKLRKKRLEKVSVLCDVLQRSNYNSELMLMTCGILISKSFTDVDGRVLQVPKLKAVNAEYFFTQNGKWNFNNKGIIRARDIEKWAVNDFSACCHIKNLVQDLVISGGMKGIKVEQTFVVFDENPSVRQAPAVQRMEEMFDQVEAKIPGAQKFMLCVLAGRKDSDVYGSWKRKCHAKFMIFTQCLSLTIFNNQYLTNIMLKINAELGGLNSVLQMEAAPVIPLSSCSYPRQSNASSIAAVMLAEPDPKVLEKAIKAKLSVFTVIVIKDRNYEKYPIVITGSAFVIKQTGGRCILLTCEHVVHGDDGFSENTDMIYVRRMCDRRGMRVEELQGHLMFHDKSADLAMIRVDGVTARVPVLTLDCAAKFATGKSAIVIGYCTPQQYIDMGFTRAPAISPGVIRSLQVKRGGEEGTEKLCFNLSCAGMKGMSGGPVMCSDSNDVVAVLTSGTLPTTSDGFRTTYALCTETVHGVIREWLGLRPTVAWSFEELIERL